MNLDTRNLLVFNVAVEMCVVEICFSRQYRNLSSMNIIIEVFFNVSRRNHVMNLVKRIYTYQN